MYKYPPLWRVSAEVLLVMPSLTPTWQKSQVLFPSTQLKLLQLHSQSTNPVWIVTTFPWKLAQWVKPFLSAAVQNYLLMSFRPSWKPSLRITTRRNEMLQEFAVPSKQHQDTWTPLRDPMYSSFCSASSFPFQIVIQQICISPWKNIWKRKQESSKAAG